MNVYLIDIDTEVSNVYIITCPRRINITEQGIDKELKNQNWMQLKKKAFLQQAVGIKGKIKQKSRINM